MNIFLLLARKVSASRAHFLASSYRPNAMRYADLLERAATVICTSFSLRRNCQAARRLPQGEFRIARPKLALGKIVHRLCRAVFRIVLLVNLQGFGKVATSRTDVAAYDVSIREAAQYVSEESVLPSSRATVTPSRSRVFASASRLRATSAWPAKLCARAIPNKSPMTR